MKTIEDIPGTKISEFSCKIVLIDLYDRKTPVLIQLCNYITNEVILAVTVDAVDSMNFADIKLPELNDTQRQHALESLQLGLKKYGGGKCIFPVLKELAQSTQQLIGIGIIPTHPLGRDTQYIKDLLYFSYSHHPKAQEKFAKDAEQIKQREEEYLIITNEDENNRNFLTSLSDKFSELFNTHTTWGNGSTYTPMGLCHRINNPNITFYAAFKKANLLEPVSCGRMHNYKDVFYFGDFVVHTEHRKHGLGKYMMEIFLNDVPEDSVICLIAGGDAHAKTLYENLGFESIKVYFEKNEQAVCLNNNRILMTGIIESEKGTILKQYQDSLREPSLSFKSALANKSRWTPILFKPKKSSTTNTTEKTENVEKLAANDPLTKETVTENQYALIKK